MDDDTLALLRTSIEHVLTTDDGTPLATRLDELGWQDVTADDESAAVRTLFEVKGATRSPAPVLDVVVAERAASLLREPRLADASLLLGSDLRETRAPLHAGQVVVDGFVAATPADDARLFTLVRDEKRSRFAMLPVGELDRTAVAGLDPSLGLTRVTGTAPPEWIDGDGDDDAVLADLTAYAQRALAAEHVGLGEVMLRDAVQYACDRRQYGRAIGSFQAVQHRLADARACLTGAAVVVEEAFNDSTPWTATVAKALAGRAFEEVSRQSQQAYGAIGFTWEHEFHRFLRRGYLVDALFGDWRSLQEEIGRAILDTRSVTRIGSL